MASLIQFTEQAQRDKSMFYQTLLAIKKNKKDKQECKMDRRHSQVDMQFVLAKVNQQQMLRQAG